MNKYHEVEDFFVDGKTLHMTVDGVRHLIDMPSQSKMLFCASIEELKNVEVSPAGYGRHWPDVDEDLAVDGLIGLPHEIPGAVAEQGETYGV